MVQPKANIQSGDPTDFHIRESALLFLNKRIIGLVVEFIVAIDEARVRFADDAFNFDLIFFASFIVLLPKPS